MIRFMDVRSLAVVASLFAGVGGACRAQSPELDPVVRDGLRQYAGLDPIAVTFQLTHEAGQAGRDRVPPKVLANIVERGTELQQIALHGQRIYLRRSPVAGTKAKNAESGTTEIAFDAEVLYLGTPVTTPGNPDDRSSLVKWLPGRDAPESGYFSSGYLRAAGIRVAERSGELVRAWHPQSEVLALLAEGGVLKSTGKASLDGRPLVLVRIDAIDRTRVFPPVDVEEMEQRMRAMEHFTEAEIRERVDGARKSNATAPPRRNFEFTIDPEKGFAARRIDVRDGEGRLLKRTDCSEHEQLAGRAVWLPRKCRVEEYEFVGLPGQVFATPLFAENYLATEIDHNPWPEGRFQLRYTTPGSRVSDATHPEVRSKHGFMYEAPADPQKLDEVIDRALQEHQLRQTPPVAPARRPLWLRAVPIAGGVSLLALAAVLIVRRRMRAAT